MTMHLHQLTGCSPTPLALYLKALGVLRLVSEQADPNARGWWQDEHFCLLTTLARTELEAFFLEQYSPSAVFNPWGGRSGFYGGSNEATARMALTAIEESNNRRFADFKESISLVRDAILRSGGDKPEGDARDELVKYIRLGIRGPGAEWLATVLADLNGEPYGPPLFGTGGNEGSGSYTAAYFAAVAECVVQRGWDESLPSSLWETGVVASQSWTGSFRATNPKNRRKSQTKTVKAPFRQFLPEGDASPWDLLLLFEGAMVVRSGVTRRSASQSRFVSSPFYFAPHGVGAPTSCESDEFIVNKGRRTPGRGEQWFPIWRNPTTYAELQALFSEGRCSVGRKQAKKPIDAARAVGRLGIDRGVAEFVRYGYLQRNNLATHFAVPLGRVRVRQHPRSHLIDDIATWLDRLQRIAREKHAPARLVYAERKLADAVFAVLTHDDSPSRWQAVLEAAVNIESIQSGGTAISAGPIPGLQPGWVQAMHDGSREMRLALSIGSAAAGFSRKQQPFDSIRHHWLPLERGAYRFQISDKRLVNDPRVVAMGRDPIVDCAAIVQRRFIEARMDGRRNLPLRSAWGCAGRLSDLAMLLDGRIDLTRVVTLGRGLMALRWDQWSSDYLAQSRGSDAHPDEAWLALRLACLPWPIAEGLDVPTEPSIISRLLSGDGTAAVRIAASRLGASGLRLPFQAALADATTARLWAAALVFPISRYGARRAVNVLVPNFFGDSHA